MRELRTRTSLDGVWQFSIPGGFPEPRIVPGSYECVGKSEYRRTFPACLRDGRRVFLTFEGITYEAEVSVNGSGVGRMLPYSFYAFDITDLLRDGENELSVAITDLGAPYGPAEGWKSFSGIIRSVYLETVPSSRLEDVFFSCRLAADYRSAECDILFETAGADGDASVSCALLREGRSVAEGTVQASAGRLTLNVPEPLLWSPEAPNLYTLETTLLCSGAVSDLDTRTVGLKEFRANGSRFSLNGQEIFLAGVCRHDIWDAETGFTQTDETIETDLRMIKQMGANYVRLVHYPHDRRVLEVADRIGLLVSEEPGLWWNDLSNREITSRALEVLRRVIRRDRSHVSVAFWLCFIECPFHEGYMREAVAVTRQADPTRLVSGANCNDIHETKALYDRCGMDFYTMHPYGATPDSVNGGSLEECARVLSGKPLLFTEWGGCYVVDNPNLFSVFLREMRRLRDNREPEPVLAGISYWQWQDIPEAQRGEPACVDGILTEGLVDSARRRKVDFGIFHDFLTGLSLPPAPPAYEFLPNGAGITGEHYVPILLPQGDPAAFHRALEASSEMPGYVHKTRRRMTFGPQLRDPVSALGALAVDLRPGIPVTLSSADGPLTVGISRPVKELWFIGHATLGKGWPLSGEYGETIGRYVIRYADGRETKIPIRNGMETAGACCLIGPTLFDPRCSAASRAFRFSYDKDWEIYQANLFRVKTEPSVSVESVRIEITREGYFLLTYGMTAAE